MIVDFQADPGHAALYDIIDAAIGRSMYDQPIFYADDETGVYRVYLTDANGQYYVDPSDPDEMAREERRGAFRLVLKARAGEVPERAETWRT
jgi:uncharacterized protein YegP (UPF0339 family)